jgi:acetyltransferase-like isoleucine patch superfamily enzyme
MLESLLNWIIRRKRDRLMKAFNRCLPINELFSDRWEKARYLNFGKGTSIYDSSLIFGEVTVGKNTWIGPFVILDGTGGLSIGENCSISCGVQIYSHDTVQWAISGGKESYEYAPVSIGKNCYIGPNVIISKGVTLGDCCIVGANSFVNKSFEANSKIAGNPAKILQ